MKRSILCRTDGHALGRTYECSSFEGELTNDFIRQAKERGRLSSSRSMNASERVQYGVYEEVLLTAELDKTQADCVSELRSRAQSSFYELGRRELMQQAALLAKVDYRHVGNYRTA